MNINWLRSLFPRLRAYTDLYSEMAGHLEEKTDALVVAGLSRDEAARAARRQLQVVRQGGPPHAVASIRGRLCQACSMNESAIFIA